MTTQPEKPDFIADQLGNVQDVRHEKYEPDPTPSSLQKPESVPSQHGRSATLKPWHSWKPIRYAYVVSAVVVAVVAFLVFRFLNAEQLQTSATDYFNQAEKYFDGSDYGRAITYYDKAIQLKPDFGQAYNNRGLAYHASGDYDKALVDFNVAMQIIPNSASVYSNRGLAYLYKGDYDIAISDFDKAIQLQPSFAKAFYNRGLAYFNKGNYDKAIVDFSRAIELTPETVSALPKPQSANNDKASQAIVNNLETIQFEPDLPSTYTNRGGAYLYAGDHEKAFADLNKAIQLRPDFALAYYNRAGVYYSLGDYDQAIADYKKVLEINNDPVVRQEAEARLNELGVK